MSAASEGVQQKLPLTSGQLLITATPGPHGWVGRYIPMKAMCLLEPKSRGKGEVLLHQRRRDTLRPSMSNPAVLWTRCWVPCLDLSRTRTSDTCAYLESMFASPPRGQLLWWHINNGHYVSHLQKMGNINHSLQRGQEESTIQTTTLFITANHCTTCEQLRRCQPWDICLCKTNPSGARVTALYNTRDTAVPKETVLKGSRLPAKGHRSRLMKLQT